MQDEQQVTIRGTPLAISTWIQQLSGTIATGWSRGTEIEKKVRGKRGTPWPICLIWQGQAFHPKTALFLQPISDSEVGVMTLIPLDRKNLAPEDRTAVLQAFKTAFIDPHEAELEMTEKLVSARLEEEISPQAFARFGTFAQQANKSILNSGLDLPRWYDFLIQLHRDGSHPPREIVTAALEQAAFSDEVVQHLLNTYDHTDDLLRRYDAFEYNK